MELLFHAGNRSPLEEVVVEGARLLEVEGTVFVRVVLSAGRMLPFQGAELFSVKCLPGKGVVRMHSDCFSLERWA